MQNRQRPRQRVNSAFVTCKLQDAVDVFRDSDGADVAVAALRQQVRRLHSHFFDVTRSSTLSPQYPRPARLLRADDDRSCWEQHPTVRLSPSHDICTLVHPTRFLLRQPLSSDPLS